MTLLISRDADGNVTITNPTTGQSMVRPTAVTGQPAHKVVEAARELPAHSWSKLA